MTAGLLNANTTNMKKGFSLLVSLCSLVGFAQSSAEVCEEKQSSVRETILLRHVDEAKKLYQEWYKECPSQRDAQFEVRMELLDYALAEDFPDPAKAVDGYAAYVQPIYAEFPHRKNELLKKEAYGLYLLQAPKAKVLPKFDEAFAGNPQSFLSDELRVYFEVASQGWTATDWKQLLQLQDKLELFIHADGRLDGKAAQNYYRLLNDMQQLNNRLVPQDSIVPYYQRQQENYAKNADWYRMVLTRLDNKGLRLNDFTREVAETSFKLAPNRTAAEILGLYYYQKGQPELAEEWYLKAISRMSDKSQIADLYFNLGTTICMGTDKAKAKQYLIKAAETSKEKINAYILLAQMYQSAKKECANTPQEEAALSLLAARALDKVMAAQPSMKESLSATKAKYMTGFPTKEELKKNKWNGKSVAIGCWINETVPFDK